jgi:hypothetical protein
MKQNRENAKKEAEDIQDTNRNAIKEGNHEDNDEDEDETGS